MATGLGPAAASVSLDNILTTYPFMQLHIGNPGAAGSANVAGNNVRKTTFWNLAGGEATLAADVDWVAVAATEQYTFCTMWTLVAAGVFGASGILLCNPVTSGDNFRLPSGLTVARFTLAS